MWRRVVTKLTDVSEVRTASIIRAMKPGDGVGTSETLVNFNVTTQRYIPQDSKLHTRLRENLKSHISCQVSPTSLSDVSAGTARALVYESGTIRTQKGKHNGSVMVALYGTPCATPPVNRRLTAV
jgi:hypothetical protein